MESSASEGISSSGVRHSSHPNDGGTLDGWDASVGQDPAGILAGAVLHDVPSDSPSGDSGNREQSEGDTYSCPTANGPDPSSSFSSDTSSGSFGGGSVNCDGT